MGSQCNPNTRTINMKITLAVILLGAVLMCVMADDEYKAASNYEKKYDGYFQYANVPGEHEYEFGYNRGNPHHYTSRYEQAKDRRFRTKVKWADSYDGYGEHYWEYNHGHHHEPAYVAPSPLTRPLLPLTKPLLLPTRHQRSTDKSNHMNNQLEQNEKLRIASGRDDD